MAYPKPLGYKYAGLKNGASRYKPNNGYVSGGQYGPALLSAYQASLNFSAAPASGSQLVVKDGPPNQPGTPTKTFTFTYSGSPGPGIIPLVAGGGTAAQAAAAAALAMSAQLNNWTVTNPSTGLTLMIQKNKGFDGSLYGLSMVGTTNISIVSTYLGTGSVLPARFGKNYAFLSG